MSLFWNLEVKPGNEYSQTVEHTFRLTNVTIAHDADLSENVRSSLLVKATPCVDEDCERYVTLCNLTSQNNHAMLDLMFGSGEEVSFKVPEGGVSLHLSGNYVPEEDEQDYDMYDGESVAESLPEDVEAVKAEDDESINSDDIESITSEDIANMTPEERAEFMEMMAEYNELSDEDEDMDQSEDEIMQGKIVEVEEEEEKTVKFAEPLEDVSPEPVATKKVSAKVVEVVETKSTKPKQSEIKSEKPVEKKAVDKKAGRQVLSSGVAITDMVVGTGAVAKGGKRLQMRYIGKFSPNHATKANKQFDANTSGKPFSFVLGRGEVIKAWDLGLEGMKIGGQRIIECPSKLAYGKKGAGKDIPPNSDLVFEVKLLNVK